MCFVIKILINLVLLIGLAGGLYFLVTGNLNLNQGCPKIIGCNYSFKCNTIQCHFDVYILDQNNTLRGCYSGLCRCSTCSNISLPLCPTSCQLNETLSHCDNTCINSHYVWMASWSIFPVMILAMALMYYNTILLIEYLQYRRQREDEEAIKAQYQQLLDPSDMIPV